MSISSSQGRTREALVRGNQALTANVARRRWRRTRLLAAALMATSLVACAEAEEPPPQAAPTALRLVAPADAAAWLTPFIAHLADTRVAAASDAPSATTWPQAAGQGELAISLVADTSCAECFTIEHKGRAALVRSGGALGAQYGLAVAMEALGYRFAHPRHTKRPAALPASFEGVPSGPQAPAVAKRRGLHLHTLHPLESLYDFWLPGPEHLQGALAVIDFVAKNRGNYLQWCALDDITDPGPKGDAAFLAWRDHTRAINAAAHARGLRVGIALQLFGSGNLQRAFDLVDGPPGPKTTAAMHARLERLFGGNGFDTANLSFGEFSGEDPAHFVAQVDEAYAAMQKVQPGIEVTATIHVGNLPELRVTYKGKSQLYYFLVRYANAAIVPWVHTVMYYTLFDDAGGAYGHAEFDEHRAFLFERLQAKQPVGYFPESAYWVAFDINVPIWLPLYSRSRLRDLTEIAAAGAKQGSAPLANHVVFSSGWEWGYALTDALSLQAGYALPADFAALQLGWWRAWGAAGAQVAKIVTGVADSQAKALIDGRLAPYLAGREAVIDIGFQQGIIAQPDRLSFAAARGLDASGRAKFVADVLQPLEAHGAELAAAHAGLLAVLAPGAPVDPWLQELIDGAAVTAARTRFVAALYRAVLADAAGDGTRDARLADAEAQLALADAAISARHAALWDPTPSRLTTPLANPTLYQYGYLRQAETRCFWIRERAQVRNLLLSAGESVRPCVLSD